MQDFYVIDGYNILYAWPELQKIKESSLEHARDKLIAMMIEFSALTGDKIIIVFDAHQVKNGAEHLEVNQNVDVYYTDQGETADSLIEGLVGELTEKGRVYVSTYDWDEQKVIFGRGAYRLTPKELLQQVKTIKKEREKHAGRSLPTDNYLELRLNEDVREMFEQWRRRKR